LFFDTIGEKLSIVAQTGSARSPVRERVSCNFFQGRCADVLNQINLCCNAREAIAWQSHHWDDKHQFVPIKIFKHDVDGLSRCHAVLNHFLWLDLWCAADLESICWPVLNTWQPPPLLKTEIGARWIGLTDTQSKNLTCSLRIVPSVHFKWKCSEQQQKN